MEDLTKTQTILLCLLVSFVTSIGTGIITVSLLQEAPTSVTQTIQQVVERTVEKVTPSNSTNTVTTKETVVVKEEDLLIDAIKKNRSSMVRIYENSNQAQPVMVALGIVVSSKGIVLSDKRIITPNHLYTATFFDGKQFPMNILATDDKNNNIYLQVLSEPGYAFSPVKIGNSDAMQLGQTVIALGGQTQNQVAVGRVGVLNTVAGSTPSASPTVTMLQLDSPLRDGVPGTLLLNLNGELVGIKIWQPDSGNESQYTPINILKAGGQDYFESPKNNNP